MRLIDADALVMEITENPPVYNANRVVDVIKSQPTVCDWISVKDRLPEDERYYIVCVLAGDGTKFVTMGTYSWWYKRWRGKVGIMWPPDRVTHWMPLPEPPEEVSEDETD